MPCRIIPQAGGRQRRTWLLRYTRPGWMALLTEWRSRKLTPRARSFTLCGGQQKPGTGIGSSGRRCSGCAIRTTGRVQRQPTGAVPHCRQACRRTHHGGIADAGGLRLPRQQRPARRQEGQLLPSRGLGGAPIARNACFCAHGAGGCHCRAHGVEVWHPWRIKRPAVWQRSKGMR